MPQKESYIDNSKQKLLIAFNIQILLDECAYCAPLNVLKTIYQWVWFVYFNEKPWFDMRDFFQRNWIFTFCADK